MSLLPFLQFALPTVASLLGNKQKTKAEQAAQQQDSTAEAKRDAALAVRQKEEQVRYDNSVARQEPFRQAGLGALERYQTLLGIPTTPQPNQSMMQLNSGLANQDWGAPTTNTANADSPQAAAPQPYYGTAESEAWVNQQVNNDPDVYVNGERDNGTTQKLQDKYRKQYALNLAAQQAQRQITQQPPRPAQQQQQQAPMPAPRQSTASILDIIKGTPGYQFAQQQGEQAAIRAASASGFGGSGNLMAELVDRSSQLAQGTFQGYMNNLQSLIGGGQNAANSQGPGIQNQGLPEGGQSQGASTRRQGALGSELLGDLTQIGGYALGQYKTPPRVASSTSLSGGKLNLSQFSN